MSIAVDYIGIVKGDGTGKGAVNDGGFIHHLSLSRSSARPVLKTICAMSPVFSRANAECSVELASP